MNVRIHNFIDIFSDVAKKYPDRPALTDYATLDGKEGNSYTYGEWYSKVLSLCGLFHAIGLKRGDHIAICGYNSANWVVSYFAITAFGGVAVTLPNNIPINEIIYLTSFSDTHTLIADSDIIDLIPSGEYFTTIISLKDFSVLSGKGVNDSLSASQFTESDLKQPAQICFTSGSLSNPKAVVLSFENLSNNLRNAVDNLPDCHCSSSIAVLPLFHSYGLLGGVLCQFPHAHQMFFFGSALSFEILMKSIARIRPYSLVIVPSIIESIYKRLGCKITQLLGDNLKQLLVGGAAMDSRIEDNLLNLGLPLTVGYGMTETAPLIGADLWSDFVPHSCGRVVSGMEVKISDCGEILARGANVMLGYYKDPEATRRKIDAEGWLHTGDRGRVEEDGTLYVYGRMEQDMIVLPSGENIIPQNIEALLDKLDGVAESLVLERSGRLVALVFPEQTHDEPRLNRNALLQAINVQLPSFSQLDDIEFVSEPFQRTGKSGIKRYLYR